MSKWRFFHAATGVLLPGDMELPNAQAVVDNTPAGYVATDLDVDPATQRIDVATGEPVAHEPPSTVPAWDAPTARAERDRLLAACDWVTTRAIDLGEPVPATWRAYRAALRGLPEQPGFPGSISWPTPPTV